MVAAQSIAEGLKELEQLNLGSYDLAIDLRYDRDTRPILRSIDATIRSGYGNSALFPFLDVILPWYDVPSISGSSQLHLSGEEVFLVGSKATAPQPIQTKAVFTTQREVRLQLQIEGARSPKDCGISLDDRLLGVGLESAVIRLGDLPGTIETTPMFGSGWAKREHWGTWTNQTRADFAIPIPP
jgi:hypothetical protein